MITLGQPSVDMFTLGQASVDVATALPPMKGEYADWDWQTYYNAILHVMQNPTSQAAYYTAYRLMNELPPGMKMTPQVLAAGWARFTKLYPGWKPWNYSSAYESMNSFMQQTGRLLEDDGQQWFVIEREWQEMEAAEMAIIARLTSSPGR